MRTFMKRAARYLLAAVGSVFFLFALAVPQPAHAIIDVIVGSAIAPLVIPFAMILSYLINQILGLAFSFASYFVELTLHFNDLILDRSNSLVQVGWGIARDLANLGFVLVIIVIALGIMFRVEKYGSQKLLVRLIAAAILVNFSLTIAGVVISFAGTVTHFFLDPLIGNGAGVADAISGAFSPQRFLLKEVDPLPPDPGTQGGFFTSLSTATFTSLADLIFGASFMMIAVLTMWTLAFMLLVRYLWLSFLLVVAPMTWLFWVIPDLAGYFSKWWGKFIEWVFFAPAVSFFLYLSIAAAQKLGTTAMQVRTDFVFPALANTMIQGAQMFVLAGILLGGLIAAKSMGIAGANIGLNLANKAKAGTLAWAGKQAKRGRDAVWDRVRTAGKEYDPIKKETTTRFQRWGSALQGVPGFTGVGTFIAKQGATVPKVRPEEIEKYRKEDLEALSNEGIIRRATSKTAFLDPSVAAAISQELARRDLTGDARITPLMSRFIANADRMGNAQAIFNNRPDLAPVQQIEHPPGSGHIRPETNEEAMTRAVKKIKAADITQISHKQVGKFDDPAHMPSSIQLAGALALSNAQLGTIARGDDARQVEAVRNTIAWAKANRATLPLEQQQQFDRVHDYIDRSPHWQSIP